MLIEKIGKSNWSNEGYLIQVNNNWFFDLIVGDGKIKEIGILKGRKSPSYAQAFVVTPQNLSLYETSWKCKGKVNIARKLFEIGKKLIEKLEKCNKIELE